MGGTFVVCLGLMSFSNASETLLTCHVVPGSRNALLHLQIVTGMTPTTRGKLPTPETPQDCPADIWDLVQQCLLLKPEDRPSAKEVRSHASLPAAAVMSYWWFVNSGCPR